MQVNPALLERIAAAVQPARLQETAVRLIEVPSPTGDAGPALDRLAEILQHDGFDVERPHAGRPNAPAVAVRFDSGRPGKTLQFSGHLDAAPRPFAPPRVEAGVPFGGDAGGMKPGVAAMVEALRAVRDAGLPAAGEILLTAHEMHYPPRGDGSQLERLIADGFHGDGALIPESTSDVLPVVGCGLALFEVAVRRAGESAGETPGGIVAPDVSAVGNDVVARFLRLRAELASRSHPSGLRETVFVEAASAGGNPRRPTGELQLAGTRRWLPETDPAAVRREFFGLLTAAEEGTAAHVDGEFRLVRDAFELNESDWLVDAFQAVCTAARGKPLPAGVKPFVDDGNTFFAHGVPSITHGPAVRGAHTANERFDLKELERTAAWYAATAAVFCDA